MEILVQYAVSVYSIWYFNYIFMLKSKQPMENVQFIGNNNFLSTVLRFTRYKNDNDVSAKDRFFVCTNDVSNNILDIS